MRTGLEYTKTLIPPENAAELFYEALADGWEELDPFAAPDAFGGTSRRLFECSATDLAEAQSALGRAISVADLQTALLAAVNRGAAMGRAAAAIARAPRNATDRARFSAAFGGAASAVPSWRPANATWKNFGELIAVRLERAANILSGGWIRVFCWHRPANCPECSKPGSALYACSSFKGLYLICLGAHFYRCMRNGNTRLMASTFLHEALHIYFGTTVGHGAQPLAEAGNYESFAVQVDGGTTIYC